MNNAHTKPIMFVYFYKRGQFRVTSADSQVKLLFFLPSSTLSLSLPSLKKGVMMTWSFSKLFFSYQVDRQTLFNGQKAGVLYDVALYYPNPNYRHILDTFSLCAVANSECVFFVTLDPAMTLKQTIVLEKAGGSLPIVAWRLAYTPPR